MQSVDRVAHDAVVDVVEVLVGVGADGLGALQEGQGHGAGLAAAGTAHEEEVLAAEGERADGVFGGVVVDLQSAVGRVAVERLALVGRIAHGFGQERRGQDDALGGDLGQPLIELVQQRDRLGLPDLQTPLRFLSPDGRLDLVQRADAQAGCPCTASGRN